MKNTYDEESKSAGHTKLVKDGGSDIHRGEHSIDDSDSDYQEDGDGSDSYEYSDIEKEELPDSEEERKSEGSWASYHSEDGAERVKNCLKLK